MRVSILILLLAVTASAGFFDTKFGEKIRNTWSKIKTALDRNALAAIREKIHGLREKIKAKLTLSPERKARLAELMKQVIRFKKSHVHPQGDSIEEINAKTKIGKLLYQGDIVLTNTQAEEIAADVEDDGASRAKRQAFRDPRYPKTTWEKGVYYFFHPNATEDVKRVFRKGADLWMKDTCINFIESETAEDKIRVFKEEGCWSFVGKLGGVQNLSLGDGCESVGTAAHEIGHALGFFHTHSRHDRDKYITFNPDNVKPDWLDQFTKQSTNTNENYGIKYDYGSIMHYGANSATRNELPTMVPNDPKYTQTLGSPMISFYELVMMNFHYGCNKICKKETSIKCSMGGLPHPRNCSVCICPSGYGGKDCKERPSGCGEELEATDSYKTLKKEVGDRRQGYVERDEFDKCIYWIKAPAGKKIEVKLVSFSGDLAVDGCQYAGVEIKTHKDQKLTGYRFCAAEDAGVTLKSSGSLVPIIMYNRVYATETVIQYRIAP